MTEQAKDITQDAPVKLVRGKPWTTVATFNTFEEADKRRFEVIANEPTFKAKVRRSGPNGLQYTVKKREDPKLAKVSAEMDAISERNKNKKKRAVSKKKTRSKSE